MQNLENAPITEFREPEALLKTRAFEIQALSTAPSGISFITGETLPRPNMKQTLLQQGEYGEKIIKSISDDIKHGEVPRALRAVIENSDQTKEAENQAKLWREAGVQISQEQIEAYIQRLKDAKFANPSLLTADEKSRYLREYEKTNKFGLRRIAVSSDGNTMIADVVKVPFVAYKHIRKPEDVERGIIEFADPTGVCNILETTEPEGSPHNYFILGRRYEENGSYRASKSTGGQPGALGAGLMDATFSRNTPPGHPQGLSNQVIFNEGNKELQEEAGFSRETEGGNSSRITTQDIKDYALGKIKEEAGPTQQDISGLKIVCFGRDLVAPHNEFGLSAVSGKSRSQLMDIHRNMRRIEDDRNFSEGVFSIPATPEAVEKFVTQCRSLMPPTHYMPLIGAMYEKIATRNGGGPRAKVEADRWKKRVEEGVDKLWELVDQMVTQYYIDVPQAIEDNKIESKRDSINTKGFDPAVLAERQIMERQPDGSYRPVTLNSELERLSFPQN